MSQPQYGPPPFNQPQPQYFLPAPAPVKPPISGLRLASGIILIVFSLLLSAFSMRSLNGGFDAEYAFYGITSWAVLYSGIVLIVRSRSTTPLAPTLGLSMLGVFVATFTLVFLYPGIEAVIGLIIFLLVWGTPVSLLIVALVKERNSARAASGPPAV